MWEEWNYFNLVGTASYPSVRCGFSESALVKWLHPSYKKEKDLP